MDSDVVMVMGLSEKYYDTIIVIKDQFEGGDLELMSFGRKAKLKQGHVVFASFFKS